MTQYVGNNPTDVLNGFIKRYFYGLRRNDDGEMFLIRLDQLAPGTDPITLNELGEADGNFPDFEEGIDFLDGPTRTRYFICKFKIFQWDGRSLVYYVDQTDGQFVLRISEGYTYPTGHSSDGDSSTYGGLAGSGY